MALSRLPLLTLVLLAATLIGCGAHQNNVTTGNREGILHFGNGDEPQELDPHIVTGVPEHHILVALLEGLVVKDPQTLAPMPGVAESWDISDDGLTYTFHLRDTARWSNGDPVTADDFAWSWWRALQPALGNQNAYMMFPIKNSEAYATGQLDDFAQVGIKAIDPLTLQVTLNNPTPYFLQLLDHYSMFPVHRPTIEKFGRADERFSRWTRPGNFVGNGPFTLKEWKLNKLIAVEKNPRYWDADSVRLNGIHFYPVQNVTTEERMFRAGQLHYTGNVPVSKIAQYRANDPQVLKIAPYLGTYFYRINTKMPHLSDARVRRALSLAIDRQQIVERITQGGEQIALTFTPPDTMGYTADAMESFNPDKARQLLAEAGYPNGLGFPAFELLYNTSEAHQKIAVAIQQMWKVHLNVDIRLSNQDWKVYLDSVDTGNYSIARAGWIGDYVDPNTFLDMWVAGSGNNRTGWSNPRFDEIVTRLAPAAKTVHERYDLLREAERILLREMPVIPIYIYTNKSLVQTAVKGAPSNIMDYQLYKNIWLDSDV
ncbi:MAG: peptide ABC transporter substrate-binding protein [bacterium]